MWMRMDCFRRTTTYKESFESFFFFFFFLWIFDLSNITRKKVRSGNKSIREWTLLIWISIWLKRFDRVKRSASTVIKWNRNMSNILFIYFLVVKDCNKLVYKIQGKLTKHIRTRIPKEEHENTNKIFSQSMSQPN